MIWWAETNKAGWLLTDGRARCRPNRHGHVSFAFGERRGAPLARLRNAARAARRAMGLPSAVLFHDNQSPVLMALCIETARQMNLAEAAEFQQSNQGERTGS